MKNYLDATQDAGKAFYMRGIPAEFTMLNLLKFNDVANYTGLESIAPEKEISGKEAYQLYMEHTIPFLKNAGSKVLFFGKGGHFLIGPENEKWDAVLLVKHSSVSKFIAFAQDKDYLAVAGHRKAALIDSRLLPIESEEI